MFYTKAKALEAGWPEADAQGFSDFMNELDAFVMGICGMSLNDLPDYDFASAYEDEADVRETAEEILEDAGWEF